MKKILLFFSVAVLLSTCAFSQSTVLLRGDTIKIYKQGGSAELVLQNSTRARTGAFLKNAANGRTEFAYAVDTVYMANDSTLIVCRGDGCDTLLVRGSGGGTPTWQQTLTAGSTLTGNNTIAGGGFNFIWDNLGTFTAKIGSVTRFRLRSISSDLISPNSLNGVFVQDDVVHNQASSSASNSHVFVYPDSININPHLGQLFIDTLTNSAASKVLHYNPVTGLVSYADTTATSLISPAGNYGNLQINRNGTFATPGSDSLDFESATGLSVKGDIGATGTVNSGSGDLKLGGTVRISDNTIAGRTTISSANGRTSFLTSGANAKIWLYGSGGSNNMNIEQDNGGSVFFDLSANGGSSYQFNAYGENEDFSINGDTQFPLFYTDASTDRVGIGTNSPQYRLHGVGTAYFQNGGVKEDTFAIDLLGGDYTMVYPGIYYITDATNNLNFSDPTLWIGHTITIWNNTGNNANVNNNGSAPESANGGRFGQLLSGYSYVFKSATNPNGVKWVCVSRYDGTVD